MVLISIDVDCDSLSKVIEDHEVSSIPHVFLYLNGDKKDSKKALLLEY